jgi:pimeloyl-ACP methyl ester carboxylesterase
MAKKNYIITYNLTNVKAELLGSGFAPLDAGQLHRIQIPTLLVTGQHSISLFHCLTGRIEELLPHSERTEIPGAKHSMHEDNAPAYNEAVLAFLSRHHQAA